MGLIIYHVVIGNLDVIPMAIIEEYLVVVAMAPLPDHMAPITNNRGMIIIFVIGKSDGIPMAFVEEYLRVVAIVPRPDYLALFVDPGTIIINLVIGKLDRFAMFPMLTLFATAFVEEYLRVVAIVPCPDYLALFVDPGIIIINVVIGKLDGFPMFPMFPMLALFATAFVEEYLTVGAIVPRPDYLALFVYLGIIIIKVVIFNLRST